MYYETEAKKAQAQKEYDQCISDYHQCPEWDEDSKEDAEKWAYRYASNLNIPFAKVKEALGADTYYRERHMILIS